MDEENKGALDAATSESSEKSSDLSAEHVEDSTMPRSSKVAPHVHVWKQCKPAHETLAAHYLDALGCKLGCPNSLRGHNALQHKPTKSKHPALVGQIRHGITGDLMGVVRQYLSADGGTTTTINPAQMMLGPCKEGAIWLGVPDSSLLIGIDMGDCLIAMQSTGTVAWCAINANCMLNLGLSKQIRDITILARYAAEAVEQKAIQAAARRWRAEGRRVRIATIPVASLTLVSSAGSGDQLDLPARIKTRDDQLRAIIDGATEVDATVSDDSGPSDGAAKIAFSTTLGDDGALKDGGASNSASKILAIVQSLEAFHTPEGKAYVLVRVEDHTDCLPVRSRSFGQWLKKAHYKDSGKPAKSAEVEFALDLLEARAIFDAPERPIFLRVADFGGCVYIDLCNGSGEIVEIGKEGWRIIMDAPVVFRRTGTMAPLPRPTVGGSINELRKFYNLASDYDFVLLVTTMLSQMRSVGPYPVLALVGEQGTAKSTSSRLAKRLVDPNTSPLRALPTDLHDLAIAANNSHTLAFDNVSSISPRMSDALCRLSTGGGFATRALYSDDEECVFEARRPVILNGIGGFISRPDLAERTVFIHLVRIQAEQRRSEQEMMAEFEEAAPRIFGALLDGVSNGLKNLPTIHLANPPRMADYAKWAAACETAYWPAGTIMAAYEDNLLNAVHDILEGDIVAQAVLKMAERTERSMRTIWEGTAENLLERLTEVADVDGRWIKDWPQSGRALRSALDRVAPLLLKMGIEVHYKAKGHRKDRTIYILHSKQKE